MPDRVEELFDQYVAAFAVGEIDPNPYLAQVEGGDRRVLEELIYGYLDSAPSREWDREAFQASPAAEVSEAIAVSLEGASGQWPVLLPRLRRELEIKRSEVDTRLARDLGAEDEAEAGKVAFYYHDMEHGNLPAAGVSDRVIDSLASIFKTSAERIRSAGRALGPRSGFEGGPVYARRLSDADFSVTLEEDAERPSRISGKPDRIDRLFTDVE